MFSFLGSYDAPESEDFKVGVSAVMSSRSPLEVSSSESPPATQLLSISMVLRVRLDGDIS